MKKLAKLIADLETAGAAPELILTVVKSNLGASPRKPKLVVKRKRRTKAEASSSKEVAA